MLVKRWATMVCEGTTWIYHVVPLYTHRWSEVTCKRCLAKRERK
jgi:hypothetical protein